MSVSLQLLHGLQSQWRCSVVESEHVGRNVHEDASCGGMPLGDIREQLREYGRKHTGKEIDDASLLANLHNT